MNIMKLKSIFRNLRLHLLEIWSARPVLAVKPWPGLSAEEWELSIRIEDPFETARDLADVLLPGRSAELRGALFAEYESQVSQYQTPRYLLPKGFRKDPRLLSHRKDPFLSTANLAS